VRGPDRLDLVAQLERVADLLRIAGENDFKAGAYEKAARRFETMLEPLGDYLPGRLGEIPGIGVSLAREIEAWVVDGVLPALRSLLDSTPAGLLEWLEVPGLGPKKIHKIHHALGITTLQQLVEACRSGQVAALPGMGEKSVAKLMESIVWRQQHGARCGIAEAEAIARPLLDMLRGIPGVMRAEIAGSLRRCLETVGDIDLLATCKHGSAPDVLKVFSQHEGVQEVLVLGDTKCSVRTKSGRQVDVRVVDEDAFGAAWLYFTGSKAHNVTLRGRARERSLALNEYGLFHLDASGETDFERRTPARREEELYAALGFRFLEPELREEEVYWADRGDPNAEAAPLVALEHLRGVLHVHSTWSDGTQTILEMARACIQRGYEYMGITDHSRSAAYANGLSPVRVEAQWREIDAVNQRLNNEGQPFHIFKGIESDILIDGRLDYSDDMLAGFDFVIASVHQQVDMEAERMLERMKIAASHPACRMIGHPTGRLLLRREGTRMDMGALVDYCAGLGVVIEMNANPLRLDMDWRFGPRARRAGLLTSVNPDAHSIEGIEDMRYGMMIARKAGFAPASVLNTWETSRLADWFRRAPSGKRA